MVVVVFEVGGSEGFAVGFLRGWDVGGAGGGWRGVRGDVGVVWRWEYKDAKGGD